MSFMDVICCGFGAVVLLLVILETSKPNALEEEATAEQIQQLRSSLLALEDEKQQIEALLESSESGQSSLETLLTERQNSLSQLQEALEQSDLNLAAAVTTDETLTQKLQRTSRIKGLEEKALAGIPLDAEYIIFIIDTSGSMRTHAWGLMIRVMDQILNSYPEVKGLQVMNDMGSHMYPKFAGEWIQDTPLRRRAIIRSLRGWSVFSNSSPVEGIEEAIRTYHRKGNSNVAIYVLGDEFAGSSVSQVIDQVDRLNGTPDGGRKIRIHAIGFPVVFSLMNQAGFESTGVRFAILMRELTLRNEGAFVGLPDLSLR